MSKLSKKFKANKLALRTISALVLILPVITVIYYGGLMYSAFIVMIGLLAGYELCNIVIANTHTTYVPARKRIVILVVGFLYLIGFCMNMIAMRSMDDGFITTIFFFVIVWIADIAAYFTGIAIGGKKLAPQISPSKTYAGLIGAIICSAVVGILMRVILLHDRGVLQSVVSAISICIIAQVGDLVESFFKRYFNVKDSGNIIPGHGGVLDRVDGLLAASYLSWYYISS